MALPASAQWLTGRTQIKEFFMWYFAWCLGIGFAILLGVVNALWGEYQQDREALDQQSQ
ncbi:cytochrome bd-I oxidase subunit CydX [Snodgrassella communis]|uniref:Cyd operon protein YbgT n=1 Tax=Snodgrassella communis TaxID=2946699 RepID=A0A836MR30_9NEIS|nr:hypothetical protein SALWKB12_1033 [Snodgrassella communis]KDN15496.1 hypothetical protein SALWKB29_0600 [Snodgrassella communis]